MSPYRPEAATQPTADSRSRQMKEDRPAGSATGLS